MTHYHNKIPANKSSTLTYQHPEYSRQELHAVESEGDGEEITDKGNPSEEGYRCTEAVYAGFLLFEALAADVEFFNPLPLSDAADAIAGDAAEPITQGGNKKQSHRRVRSGNKHTHK